jgi:hypothetical protein
MDDVSIMERFVRGEWVATGDIQRILHISFSDGFRIFDFSREVYWNKPPLNGQFIKTFFRIKKIESEDKK